MEQSKVKRDTKSIGDRSEAVVLAALVQRGYHVLIPFGENHRYDLVVDDGSKFFRIQVKTGRLRKGVIWFNCYSSHTHRKGTTCRRYLGDIEYFGVYCSHVESVYLVPVGDVPLRGCLRIDHPKNGQFKKMRWAGDYLLTATGPEVGLGTGRLVSLPGLSEPPS